MDEKTQKQVGEFLRAQLDKEIDKSFFGGSTSTSTSKETSLSYDTLLDAIKSLPPAPPELPFNEIRLSSTGWETMKDKMNIEEKKDALGDFYVAGCQVLVRDYMPDNMAIAVKSGRLGEPSKIVYIIDLGFPPKPIIINSV